MTEHMRVLEPGPGILAFYDGRVEGYRFDPKPNWVDDGALGLGIAVYAIVDGDEALVHDTGTTLEHGRLIREELVRRGADRITVVLSHWHLDHVAGTEAFVDSPVISNERTAEHLRAKREAIEAGTLEGPPAISPLVLPTRTFAEHETLTVGATTVELIAANIHSDDQTVLWLPERRLLFCADAMEDTVTYVGEPEGLDTHLRDLERLAELEPSRILPAHGAPDVIACGGYPPELNEATQSYIRLLQRMPSEPALRGAPLRELIADSLAAGTLVYFEPYEAVHRQNVETVLTATGLDPGPRRGEAAGTLMRRSVLVLVAAVTLLAAPAGGATAFGHARAGRKPSHHAEGTGSRRHRGGKAGTGPTAKPGKPIAIGFGFRPQVLVDEAGVAHITYATQSEEIGKVGANEFKAGWDNYCRLPRGAGKCDDHARFDAPIVYPAKGPEGLLGPFFENSPGANQDIGEGAMPLATGNQLAILAHRPGNVVEVPGGTSEDVNFLWTSDGGGKQFTGPGLTSTMDYYGGAVAYGSPSSIGLFGTTGELLREPKTLGHVFFQEARAGSFAPAAARVDLGRGKNDLLARRQIIADGDRPLVAFDDLKDVFVREYKGKGDIDDAANWTTSKFPGQDPSLASGPHGVWLTYRPPGLFKGAVVVKLVDGRPTGPKATVFPTLLEGDEDQLAEAADGELVAGWTEKRGQDDEYRHLMISASTDGRHWSKPRQLYLTGPHDGVSGLQIGVGPDGGGVAVFVHGGTGKKVNVGTLFGIGGQVTVVPFGPRGSTGKVGLGTKSSGQAGCLDIRFGAVHAHVDSGCFLRVATKADPKGDASIAYGGVHVNGLEVRPDSPGTSIVIDDAAHTIESVGGNASILLQHPGVPDIKLWDGALNAKLGKDDSVGDPLFSMPMTSFHADVLGFEALGIPAAVLGDESVSIPLSLKMPAYLGVTGSATLAANMAEELVRPSLHIAIPDVVLSGLELRGGSIDWAGPEDQWTGTGELEMQPGAGAAGLDVHGAQIGFDHGDFSSGAFTTAPYPGTPIYHDAYLENLGAAFNLHPPPSLTGNAEIGAVAHGGGVYSLEATGPLQTTFGNPSTMSVEGEGAIYNVPLTSAHATFSAAGTFHETGTLGFDEFGLTIGGTLDATTDLAAGTTSGTIAGGFSFLGQSVEESIPFNDTGFGFCKEVGVSPASVSTGFLVKWEGGVEVFPTGCEAALASSGAPG